jgi:hypothetical protein
MRTLAPTKERYNVVSSDQVRSIRQRWGAITTLLMTAVFIEAVFAGAMLSGIDWARVAHAVNAVILIAATATAGLLAVIALRRIPHGTRLGFTLLSLAVVVLIQTALGRMSVHGANLMWIHVPLGAALVGFAVQAATATRRLGGE